MGDSLGAVEEVLTEEGVDVRQKGTDRTFEWLADAKSLGETIGIAVTEFAVVVMRRVVDRIAPVAAVAICSGSDVGPERLQSRFDDERANTSSLAEQTVVDDIRSTIGTDQPIGKRP